MSASLDAPTDPHVPFSTRIILSNDGNLAVQNVEAAAYIRKLVENGMTIQNSIVANLAPVTRELVPAGKQTITLGGQMRMPPDPEISVGDIGVVIHYRFWWLPFYTFKKGFRFVSSQNADGTYHFDQQPGDGVEDEYENFMRRFAPLMQIPK